MFCIRTFKKARQEQYLEAAGAFGTRFCTNPNTTVSVGCINVLADNINSKGVMTSGTFSGVDTRVEDRFDSLHTNFNQATLTGQHTLGARWSIDELIGYSESRFANPVQTTLGWDQFNQTVSYDFASRVPYLNFGSENVGTTGPWMLTEVRERPQTTTNKFKNVELNVHFKASDSVNLSGGVQVKEYDFAATSYRLVNGESVTATNVYAPLRAVPIASYAQPVNYLAATPASVCRPEARRPGRRRVCPLAHERSRDLLELPACSPSAPQGDLGNNVDVRERDYGSYLQMNFDEQLLSRDLRGNIGVRYVEYPSIFPGLFIDSAAHHRQPHLRQRSAGAQSGLVAAG